MHLAARRYATALFAAARDQNAVDQVAKDAAAIHEVFQDDTVREAFLRPDVTTDQRHKLATKLVEGHHALTVSTVRLLVHRNRNEVLVDLGEAFQALVLADQGTVQGVVESVKPLSPEDLTRMQEAAETLTGKKVILETKIDESLLGGVRLRVGNSLWDGSLRAQLEQLEKDLMDANV